MNKEDRKWLEELIEENKESDNELTYTYCPVRVLYQLQQENNQLKKQLELEIKVRDEIHNYLHNKIDKTLDLLSHFSSCQVCEHTQELAIKLEEILKGGKNE